MKAKQVLVTGALGFVGTNICQYLSSLNQYHVTGCDDLSFGTSENRLPKVVYHIHSFEKYSSFELSRYDIIIHAATCNIIFSQKDPKTTILINDVATAELFSRISPSTQIIYLSTASVYGNSEQQPLDEDSPVQLTNVYASSKFAAELHLAKLHSNFTVLRLSNVYGPYQRPENPYCGVMGKVMESMESGKDFTVYGDGKATRDYTYVGDVCRAVHAAIKSPKSRAVMNVSTGLEYNVLQVCTMAKNIKGASAFDVRHEAPRGIDNVQRRCLDPSLALSLIGWRPEQTLFSGMNETFLWYMSNLD